MYFHIHIGQRLALYSHLSQFNSIIYFNDVDQYNNAGYIEKEKKLCYEVRY